VAGEGDREESHPVHMDRETLIAKVRAAGVIGAGGAGFPTHVKLAGKVDTVIVNGAECEPLLAVDVQLLEREAETLVQILAQVLDAIGARVGIVAIKAKHQGAIQRLREALVGKDHLHLYLLDDFYPAGDEPILVHEVTGKVLPEGGIPLALGCLVINVETLWNIGQAWQDRPVTTTCVTVAGEVDNPLTVEVPVGTPIAVLLDLAGGATAAGYRIIEGGPMTGRLLPKDIVHSGRGSVQKTTKGIIVLPDHHNLVAQLTLDLGAILQRAQSACCQCRICTDLCPRYLLGHGIYPHRILNRVNHGQTADTDAITQAFLCSDCGVCELFACPVELSPRRMYQAVKAELAKQGTKNPHHRQGTPKETWVGRRIPIEQLIARLGLEEYQKPAPWRVIDFSPRQVVISLRQHIGVPALPLLKAGDAVNVGQVIATPPRGELGAAVHASIDGHIVGVSEEVVVIAR